MYFYVIIVYIYFDEYHLLPDFYYPKMRKLSCLLPYLLMTALIVRCFSEENAFTASNNKGLYNIGFKFRRNSYFTKYNGYHMLTTFI